MSALIPCSSCRRHVRRTEAVCPFCAVPLANGADAPLQTRSVAAHGVKRATLFAMGVSLAASACEADNTVPIYGAPAPPLAGAGGDGGSDNAGGSPGVGGAGDGGSGGSAGASEGPADASAPLDAAAGENDAGDAAP